VARKRNQREFDDRLGLQGPDELPKRPKLDLEAYAVPLYTPDTPSLNTARKILDILQRRKQASVCRSLSARCFCSHSLGSTYAKDSNG
jgi:hypothetical protein